MTYEIHYVQCKTLMSRHPPNRNRKMFTQNTQFGNTYYSEGNSNINSDFRRTLGVKYFVKYKAIYYDNTFYKQ